MEWMGRVTNNHWCTVPSFSGICKGISQVPTKILEISPVKTTPQNQWYFVEGPISVQKNPTHTFVLLNFCLDSLVDPTPKYYGFFLGRIFPPGKKCQHHTSSSPDTRNGRSPERICPCSSSTWRVWRAEIQIGFFCGRKNPLTKITTWMSRPGS